MTSTVRIKCCRCRAAMTVGMLDRRWPEGPFYCATCSGPKREGEPGVAEEDVAVEIADISADGVTIDAKVRF